MNIDPEIILKRAAVFTGHLLNQDGEQHIRLTMQTEGLTFSMRSLPITSKDQQKRELDRLVSRFSSRLCDELIREPLAVVDMRPKKLMMNPDGSHDFELAPESEDSGK